LRVDAGGEQVAPCVGYAESGGGDGHIGFDDGARFFQLGVAGTVAGG